MPTRKKKTATKKTGQRTSKATPKTAKKKGSQPASRNKIFEAPAIVRKALEKGLQLRPEYGGKGLVPNTITWARKLAKGAPITPQKARKMHAYFARHTVDKRANWDNPPTPGYVAWLLWGGDAARTWVKKVIKALDED